MSVDTDKLKRLIKSSVKEILGETYGTQSYVDHVASCPDCYPKVIEKASETMNYMCKNCGLPLPDKMIGENTPPCPNCGSNEAEEIPYYVKWEIQRKR
jgi:hypothetical protein